MSCFSENLANHLPHINQALNEAINDLPHSCQYIARYIVNAGGKRMRPYLTVLFANLFGYKKENLYKLASSMELLHAATLLHDDVLDNAKTRRGKPAAHFIFDTPRSILAGDGMLALANSLVAQFNNPQLCVCFSEATITTAAGEILEIDSLGQPDLGFSEYLAIAKGKTGNLLAQSCAMGVIVANAGAENLRAAKIFGENLGVAFQIIDDCLDFSPQEITGKPAGGDLREKKLTPPIFLYRQSLSETERTNFDNFFRSQSNDESLYEKYIKAISAFAANARLLATEYLNKAQAALASFPDSQEVVILLEILEKAVSRTK